MSPFHVNYQTRLAEVTAALDTARRENRVADVLGLELAARLLDQHVGELHPSSALVSA
jgi:hypothetical protein